MQESTVKSPASNRTRHRRENEENSQRRDLVDAVAEIEQHRQEKFSSANLDADHSRRLLAAFHPMLEQCYFIETDGASAFYEIVCDHAIARKSGLYITGAFRVGKTTSIENTMLRLKEDMPWLAVLYHSAKRQHGQSKKSLCDDMLRSFRYPGSTYQNSADLLARFMMAQAVQAGSKTCILFVDEAQMFTVMQLRFLLEIWNEMRQEGIILVTVMVGQEGLNSLKKLTSEEDHGAVVARFFVKKYVLGGLHNINDLKNYLAAFDTKLTFPVGSKWSYSRFFCKKAFDAGWRLESEADRLWKSLINRSMAEQNMLRYTGFRLAFVNDSIHSFLLDSMVIDKVSFKGSDGRWEEATSSAAEGDLFIGNGNG